MEEMSDQELIDWLEIGLFKMIIYSYESELIEFLQRLMNASYKNFKSFYRFNELMNENDLLNNIESLKAKVFNDFLLTESLSEIFKDFGYAINEEEDKIYFDAECMLNIFSDYIETIDSELKFDFDNTIFDFNRYFYNYGTLEEKELAHELVIDFAVKLYGFIIYKDYFKIIKSINPDLLISPSDNHIPIRIAMLNSLNLISELNNTVPNKENIYRIVHAIVGGNEDNVKKYCLSLIGQNSTSQKQITKKHLEFAQKYINEKKL